MTAAPAFTILLPVHRSPALMAFAIQSVLAQTRGDFELFIICDGAPPETTAAAEAAAAKDARLRVFACPKGARNGELHRHHALQEARGRMICQIADDDLWFPDHLAEMDLLLRGVEFGTLLQTWIAPDGGIRAELYDLADPAVRARMLSSLWNFFGPTVCGYRLSTYRRLPVGWSPAPPDIWSDLAMWRKFLSLPGIAVGTRYAVTSLHFATSQRTHWPFERRRREIARHAALLASPQWRDEMRQKAMSEAARSTVANETVRAGQIAGLQAATTQNMAELAAAAWKVAALETALREARQTVALREARIVELKQRRLTHRLRRAARLLPVAGWRVAR